MGKDLKGKELGVGFYQRKDGRYEARAKINGIDINIYGRNIKDVRKDFDEAKQKAENRIDIKRQQITLNEWFEEWFQKYKAPVVKSVSIFPMKSKYYNSFGRELGTMRVCDIRNIDIQDVINKMAEQGKASSTMREALGRVRECLESAKNNQLIGINPCFEVNVPWENKQVMRRFLSKDEQHKFLAEVDIQHNWYREMFYIMFLTGMRIGEVGGLKWEDVDFKNKCININHSLHCSYEKGVKNIQLTTPKTHNSYRKIPFFGEAEEMYRSQKLKQEQLKKQLGDRFRCEGEFDGLVFTTSMGSPVIRYHAEKEIKKIVVAINQREAFESVREQRLPVEFANMYPHAVRHTFCSRCFEAGMEPKVVQGLMGHQHYSTTIDIYTHVTDDTYEKEIQKFGNAMNPDILVAGGGTNNEESDAGGEDEQDEGMQQTFC